jgi:ParB/RepB/Spo0J family partition protein
MSKKLFSSKANSMPPLAAEISSPEIKPVLDKTKTDQNRATSFAFGSNKKTAATSSSANTFDASNALLSKVKKASTQGKIYSQAPSNLAYSPYHDRFKEWFKADEIQSLAKSVKEQTQMQPGLAYLNPDFDAALAISATNAKYLVIAGGRRLAACRKAKVEYQFTLLNDQKGLENAHELVPTLYALNLQENNQRQDTTDIEKGVSYRKMLGLSDGYDSVFDSQDALAEAFELSKSKVSKLVRAAGIFDDLPELVALFNDRRAIAVGSAYELVTSHKWFNHDEVQLIQHVRTLITQQKSDILALADRKKISFVMAKLNSLKVNDGVEPESVSEAVVERKFEINHQGKRLISTNIKAKSIQLTIDHDWSALEKSDAMALFEQWFDEFKQ